MVFPELSEGEVRCPLHLKTMLEQALRTQLLKVQDDLLIHGLEEWSGVGWQKLDLDELVVRKQVVFEAWRMSWGVG